MFTGIVTHRGRLVRVDQRDREAVVRLVLEPVPAMEDVVLGESIALDGVCLTVAGMEGAGTEGARLAFDAIPETLRKTSLGDRRVGDLMNLERALKVGDALGGHLVQGHVEGTAVLAAVEHRGDDVRMVLRAGVDLHGALIAKGSVTLDGVSLTVGEVWTEPEDDGDGRFSVYLIPHTLAVTGLSLRRPGDRINVEPDLLGRWVEHHVRRLFPAP